MILKKFLVDVFLSPDADSPDWIVILHLIWCVIALCLFGLFCLVCLGATSSINLKNVTCDGTESVATW